MKAAKTPTGRLRHLVRKFTSLSLLLTALLAEIPSAALAGNFPETLCKEHEKVVFSCPFKNGKIVSICASDDLSSETGTLQYRYGRSGLTPELAYPKKPTHPKGKFWYVEENAIFPAKASDLRFSIGSVDYKLTVLEAPNIDEYKANLQASRDGDSVLDMNCPLSKAQGFLGQLADIELDGPSEYRQAKQPND